MAKCFQVVGQGIPVRMSDEDAFQVVVRDHDGEYCPKHVWKDWNAKTGRAPVMHYLNHQGRIVSREA